MGEDDDDTKKIPVLCNKGSLETKERIMILLEDHMRTKGWSDVLKYTMKDYTEHVANDKKKEEKLEKYEQNNDKAIAFIRKQCKETPFTQVKHLKTAYKAWRKLKKRYGGANKINKDPEQLLDEYNKNTTMNTDRGEYANPSPWMEKLHNTVTEIEAVEPEFAKSEKEVMLAIVSGLPDCYKLKKDGWRNRIRKFKPTDCDDSDEENDSDDESDNKDDEDKPLNISSLKDTVTSYWTREFSSKHHNEQRERKQQKSKAYSTDKNSNEKGASRYEKNHEKESNEIICGTCKGKGHTSKQCWNNQKCYSCNEIGHISKYCPKKKDKDKNVSFAGNVSFVGFTMMMDEKNEFCGFCDEENDGNIREPGDILDEPGDIFDEPGDISCDGDDSDKPFPGGCHVDNDISEDEGSDDDDSMPELVPKMNDPYDSDSSYDDDSMPGLVEGPTNYYVSDGWNENCDKDETDIPDSFWDNFDNNVRDNNIEDDDDCDVYECYATSNKSESSTNDTKWKHYLADTGANVHVFTNKETMTNLEEYSHKVLTGGNIVKESTHKGTQLLETKNGALIECNNALYIHDFGKPIVAVTALTENQNNNAATLTFSKGNAYLENNDHKVDLLKQGGLFYIEARPITSTVNNIHTI